jgi:hypothetical protein
VSEREAQLRQASADLRQFLLLAAAAACMFVAGRALFAWGFLACAVMAAVCYVLDLVLARLAQPWQAAEPPRRPKLQLWFHGLTVPVCAGAALTGFGEGLAFVAGWLLMGAAAVLAFREVWQVRKATEPPKVPVRPGPPQEWL